MEKKYTLIADDCQTYTLEEALSKAKADLTNKNPHRFFIPQRYFICEVTHIVEQPQPPVTVRLFIPYV